MSTPHETASASNDAAMAESLGRGHEQRDATIKPIVIFCIVLTVSVVIVQFLVVGLRGLLEHTDSVDEPQKISSVAQSLTSNGLKNHVAPPEPRLQPSPFHPTLDREDWAALVQRWDTQLNTLGKFEDSERVHVPLERVMEMAAEKGLASLKPADAK